MKWVNSFQITGSLRPGTARGRDRILRISENIERVRHAVEANPCRSAVRYVRALQMSDRLVHRILHLQFHFHLHKIMIIQKLL